MRKHRIAAMILCLAVWTSSCMPAGALYAHAADAAVEAAEESESAVFTDGEGEKAEADAETGKTEIAASTDGMSAEADGAEGEAVGETEGEAAEGTEGEAAEAADNAEGDPSESVEDAARNNAAAAAEEAPETEAAKSTEEPEADGAVISGSIAGQSASIDDEGPSADELFEGYIQKAFGIGTGAGRPKLRAKASSGSKLTGLERNAYVNISKVLPLIASGERTSTEITLTLGELFEGCKSAWTAEELGVKTLVEKTASGTVITQEALDALGGKLHLDMNQLLIALLADHPYELYWFNKVKGFYRSDLNCNYDEKRDVLYFKENGEIKFYFSVEKEYSAGDYKVNTKYGAAVKKAVENAASIIDRYSAASDIDKLDAYRKEICDLVIYDRAAMTDYDSYGKPPFGNPWQLIWVFDGDPSTNVVCEGYSKAFQYLCDMSAFSADIECLTVNGKTDDEAGHQWNVVKMDDGENYLVDVTNCDYPACGAPDKLFLAGTAGSVSSGYCFDINLYNDIKYTYDEEAIDFYAESELRIADHNYGAGTSISAGTLTLSQSEYTYDGTQKKPEATLTLDGKTLREGTDYTVEYGENTNAGVGIVAVTGMGDYSGVKRAKFAILKAKQYFAASTDRLTLKIGDWVSYSVDEAVEEPGHKVIKLSGLEGEFYIKSADPAVVKLSTDAATPGWMNAVRGGKTVVTLISEETNNYQEAQIPVTVIVEPAATTKLNAVSLATGMRVLWNPVPGADGYILTRTDGAKTVKFTVKGGSTKEYKDKTANTNGTKYTYKIAAYVGDVTSTSARSTKKIRVARPAITAISSPSAGKMTVKWGRNDKAAGYQVQYSLKSDFGWTRNVTVDGTSTVSKTVSGLTKGKTYYVRVRSYALNGSSKNYSAWSKARKVTIAK